MIPHHKRSGIKKRQTNEEDQSSMHKGFSLLIKSLIDELPEESGTDQGKDEEGWINKINMPPSIVDPAMGKE